MTAGALTVAPGGQRPRSAGETARRHLSLDVRIRGKLTTLQAQKEASFAAAKVLHDRLRAVRDERDRKKTSLAHELSGVLTGTQQRAPAPDDPRQQEIDWLTDELGRLEASYHEAQVHQQAAGRVHTAVSDYVERADVATLAPIVVTYKRITDPRADLAAIRERLDALANEAQAIEVAPVSTADALARLDEQRKKVAARVASRRADRVRSFFSPGGVIDVARLGRAGDFGRHGPEVEAAIGEAADERFLADVDAWRKAITAATITGNPVALADRAPRLAQLARDRAELEREEERVVMCAERDGLHLARRETADPAVVVTTVFATDAAA